VRFFDLDKPEKEKFKVKCGPKALEIILKFSPSGHAVVIWTQNFVDTSGKSYYGEHQLQYIPIFGGTKRSPIAVFDGQVHDVEWMPNDGGFIAITGMQPACVTHYTQSCVPCFEYGRLYRNTIKVNKFGSVVALAGFGNLVGEIDFWNLKTD
jgi:translation initiation factor 2A